MTGLIIFAALVGFIVWGIIASKRTSANKKDAMADLKIQKEQIQPFDIHALVSAEIADLGLRDIDGASGIPASVLLKAWKESADIVNGCPSRDLLSFAITPGLDPSEAMDSDVALVCAADLVAAETQPIEQVDEQESTSEASPDISSE
jgi:hypothetical protein